MITEHAKVCPAVPHYHQSPKGFYRCRRGRVSGGSFGAVKQSPFLALLPMLKVLSLN